jgi:hypothetical protein
VTTERVQVPGPDPTEDPFLDYLEVRLIQSLCRDVSRIEEPRQLAFAMGMATARWVYILQGGGAPILGSVDPVDYIAAIKGRLTTMSVNEKAQIVHEHVDRIDPHPCRLRIQEYLHPTHQEHS